jgi:pilus assembly protein Flp/PilA
MAMPLLPTADDTSSHWRSQRTPVRRTNTCGGRLMKSLVLRFIGEESGQDLIEYGLLIGIITIACIASIKLIGPKVAGYFTTLNTNLP